jgi:hypothetical protein
MIEPPAWRTFLDGQFPGYLLPESAVNALTVEQAAKFLAALSGRPNQLDVVRASATLAPHAEALERFVLKELAELVRVLPSRTETETRTWTGGFVGRLDVARTSVLHSQGARTSFVTRTRRRRFDLPENVLLRWVAERLRGAVTVLRQAGALAPSGWSVRLSAIEGPLRRLLTSTVLREVPGVVPGTYEEQAARAARHSAYRSAVTWLHVLREGLDATDPKAVARVVATGALEPLEDFTQFEIAVLLRVALTLHTALEGAQPGRWRIHRTLILRDRDEAFVFERDDGCLVRIFYNRAELPSGACDLGVKYYLASEGRMRPDITIITDLPGRRRARATVIEVKLSDRVGYLGAGYQQATVYRWEYADALTGWPKAVLVVPAAVQGSPRRSDEVVAVGWPEWIPADLTRGLLADVLPS